MLSTRNGEWRVQTCKRWLCQCANVHSKSACAQMPFSCHRLNTQLDQDFFHKEERRKKSDLEGLMHYVIPRFVRTRRVKLIWSDNLAYWTCSCQLFERTGFCCRHILSVTGEKPTREHCTYRYWNVFDDQWGRSKEITTLFEDMIKNPWPGVPAGNLASVEQLIEDKREHWTRSHDLLDWMLETDGTVCLAPDSYWCNPANSSHNIHKNIVAKHMANNSAGARAIIFLGVTEESHPAAESGFSMEDDSGFFASGECTCQPKCERWGC